MGAVWYNFLNRKDKKSLISIGDCNVSDSLESSGAAPAGGGGKLYVCREVYSEYIQSSMRKYSSFETYLHFYEYMVKETNSEKHFYEIILNSMPVKPFFDIDIKIKDFQIEDVSPTFLDEQLKICCKEFAECAASVTEIPTTAGLVFSSYLAAAGEPLEKISFHVVVHGAKLDCVVDAKNFCNYTIEKFSKTETSECASPQIKQFFIDSIDTCVYKGVQQFRMLGSRKLNSGVSRTKVLNKALSYNVPHPILTNQLRQFSASLVTVGANCESVSKLTEFYTYVERAAMAERALRLLRHNSFTLDSSSAVEMELDYSDAARIIDKVKKEFGRLGVNRFPFDFNQIDKSLISLTRREESYCPICSRNHEHENPFIKVFSDGSARFYCRRDPYKRSISIASDRPPPSCDSESPPRTLSTISSSSTATTLSFSKSVASAVSGGTGSSCSVRSSVMVKKLSSSAKTRMMLKI